MRIVGGEFRGRAIVAPKGLTTRPTTDRVRESLFNIIEHSYGGCEGKRVLDLFAGSGAMGFEAVSRGGIFALFVDEGSAARGAIRENVETLGLQGKTKIFRRDATNMGRIPANVSAPFDLIFLDPPYGKGLAERALWDAKAGGWFAEGAMILVEEEAGLFEVPEGFSVLDRRPFGGTEVTFLSSK